VCECAICPRKYGKKLAAILQEEGGGVQASNGKTLAYLASRWRGIGGGGEGWQSKQKASTDVHLDGQGGDNGLGMDQGGVAQVVQPAAGDDLSAGLEPDSLTELQQNVMSASKTPSSLADEKMHWLRQTSAGLLPTWGTVLYVLPGNCPVC